MQYKFVENDGSIVTEEYDEHTRLTQAEVKRFCMRPSKLMGILLLLKMKWKKYTK